MALSGPIMFFCENEIAQFASNRKKKIAIITYATINFHGFSLAQIKRKGHAIW